MFDISPDDRRFIALRAAGSARINEVLDVVLVENWLEELKASLEG